MASEQLPVPSWLKSLAGDWTQYTLIASFALYVAGYLSLRFHVTTMGVVADHAVLDERYVFAGARFLVYLLAAVPSIAMVAGPPLVLAAWLLARRSRRLGSTATGWVAAGGIVFGVLAIQLVMRQCFDHADLLLAGRLPKANSFTGVALLNSGLKPAWFAVLVGLCLPPAAALWLLLRAQPASGALRAARIVLGLMLALQCLLLPINHGVVVDTSLPRLVGAGARAPVTGETVWLVWEGKDSVTFLLRNAAGQRSLLTLPRDQAQVLEVLAMEDIVGAMFGPDGAAKPPEKTR